MAELTFIDEPKLTFLEGDKPEGQPQIDAAPALKFDEQPAAEPDAPILEGDALLQAVKDHPQGPGWLKVAQFALTHPIRFAEGVSAATKVMDPQDKLNKPLASLPRATGESGIAGVASGAVNSAEKVVEGLTTPNNITIATATLPLVAARAVMPAKVALRAIAGYFGYKGGKAALEQAKTAGETLANPDATLAQKTEAVLDPLATAAMSAAAGRYAAKGEPVPAARPAPTSNSTAAALGYLDLTRTEAVNDWIKSDNPAETITFAKDATESATERAANTAANDVLSDLADKFKGDDLKMARKAIVPAVEAGGDLAKLQDMKNKVAASTNPAAADFIASVDFAIQNIAELAPAIEKHQAITEAIYNHAKDSGIEFPYRENYVLHAQDIEMPDGFAEPPAGGFSPASSFRKMRTYDTYADSIANGVEPRSLDGVDLLRTAVRATQSNVNRNLWTDAIAQMKDPKNGEAVLMPRTAVTRPDGSTYLDTPKGYSPVEVGGRPMAIQNGYAGLFGDLTTPSGVNRTLAKINATAKSVTLAIDTYHLGRLAAYQAASELSRGKAPLPSFKKGLLVGDMPMSAIEKMAAKGEIDPASLPTIKEDKAIIDLGVSHGLNVGRIADSLHQEWIRKIPGLGDVNRFIFEQFQRGAIYDLFTKEFRYQQQRFPELSNQQVARSVAKDVNTRLGNLGRQGVFKSQTMMDMARLAFLAPQWNEALVRSEVGGVAQLAKGAGRLVTKGRGDMGLLGRTAGTLALGGFLANQLINYGTRGIPTWENPEEGPGAKISAWVPDEIGSSAGFFLNPTTLPFEVSHLLEQPFERTGDWRDSVNTYFRGRLSSIGKVVADVATKRDAIGKPLTTAGTALDAIPVPIAAGAAVNAAKQAVTGQPSETYPGQFQKQALASFGVRTDRAPSAEQRIYALADKFKREHNIDNDAQYYSGDYSRLSNALRIGNKAEIKDSLDELRQKKTVEQIVNHYANAFKYPFTGSAAREYAFFGTLSKEQQAAYRQAQKDRTELSTRAVREIGAYLHPVPAAIAR